MSDPTSDSQKTIHQVTEEVTKNLINQGLLVEAGFASLMMCMPKDTPAQTVEVLHTFFFGGAQHLYGSIMSTFDGGAEPTMEDMRRLDNIRAELDAFGEVLKQQLGATGQFPDGKLDPSDEGELRIAISDVDDKGNVRINFGKPVAWFALPAAQAAELGKLLLKKAQPN